MEDTVYPLPPDGPQWAAASIGGGDVAYRTQSLKFLPIELTLDESVPWRVIWSLLLRAGGTGLAIFLGFALVGLIAGANKPRYEYGTFGSSGNAIDDYLSVGLFFGIIAFVVIFFFSATSEPISEWRTLLEGKAAAATSSYAAIYGALSSRAYPLRIDASRIRSDLLAPEAVNSRLVITERSYIAYVSVFEYGTSLYVGWMMWRDRRGITLFAIFIKDLLGGIVGRTGSANQMLRTERIRAMREAVHAAVREGVDTAVRGIDVPIVSTFGHELPIKRSML